MGIGKLNMITSRMSAAVPMERPPTSRLVQTALTVGSHKSLRKRHCNTRKSVPPSE